MSVSTIDNSTKIVSSIAVISASEAYVGYEERATSDGKFAKLSISGTTITAGELVKLSGANIIEGDVVEAVIIAGKVVGKAMESVALGTAETIHVEVGAI